MATPEITRKLLWRYFATAPREEIERHLEIMYAALDLKERQALKDAAKSFLLPRLRGEMKSTSNTLETLESLYDSQTASLDIALSEATLLVSEVESL